MLGVLYSKSHLVNLVLRKTVLSFRHATCWKCGSESPNQEFFCKVDHCGVVQAYKLKDVNAFQVFGLEQKYLIDNAALDNEYKNVQKLLHPDKFTMKPNSERDASNETSSTVNQAYQILSSPVCRAEYMLKLKFGIDAFEEGKTLSKSDSYALMMEVFEVRERISETDSAADLMAILCNIKADMEQIGRAFAGSIDASNQARALHYAIRLKYYTKIVEEIEQKLPDAGDSGGGTA